MQTAPSLDTDRTGSDALAWLVVAVAALLTLLVFVAMVGQHGATRSVYGLSNFVGPAAAGWAARGDFAFASEEMGTPGHPIAFQAARMPMAPVVIGTVASWAGDRYVWVNAVKVLLFAAPVLLVLFDVMRRLPTRGGRRLLSAGLLLLPFGLPIFQANVINMQVEEGYGYALIIVLFHVVLRALDASRPQQQPGWRSAVLVWAVLSLLYLTKSSFILVVAAAGAFFAIVCMKRHRATFLLALCLVPAGWALHQQAVSGRASLGTSLDGINLHKGNNPAFLSRYPPPPGESLDRFDAELNRGLTFTDEWAFNDYHVQEAKRFIVAEPMQVAKAALTKAAVLFVTLEKYGSSATTGVQSALEFVGILAFRAALLAALVLSVTRLRANYAARSRRAAIFFGLMIAASAAPYLLGFGYTRHISVLFFPSILMIIFWLDAKPLHAGDQPAAPASEARL